MKKTLIALAALAATSVFAQSSVTISGQVDAGIINPIGADKARIDQSGNGSNQIVFGGAEDLGGGMKANFRLAMRFTPESGLSDGGSSNRPYFQGESTVGLSGGFGALRLGRALTALQAPVNTTDPWGTFQQGNVAVLATGYATDRDNLSTLDGGNAATGGGLARTDGIFYTTPSFGGFSASGTYGFKQTQSTGVLQTTNPKAFTSLWLAYAGGPIYVGGGSEQNRIGDRLNVLLGTYDFGMVKLGAGVSKLNATAGSPLAAADRKSWNLSATAPLGAFLLKAGYGRSKNDATGVTTLKKTGLGVDYALSKRTIVYTSVGRDSARASDKTGFDLGIRHTF